MLSWVVNSRYTLRSVFHGTPVPLDPQPSSLHCSSYNSFPSYCFRTLASHFQTSVSSNSFEINRFRTLCKIPGIGYPLPCYLHRMPLFSSLLCFHSLTNSFSRNPFRLILLSKLAYGVGSSLISIAIQGAFLPQPSPLFFHSRAAHKRTRRGGRIFLPPVGEALFHQSRVTSHESRFYSPVPLHRKGHSARMGLNVSLTPHRETSPLFPVSNSNRADTGCGMVVHPNPGHGSCHQAGRPGSHPS
jgi:hypothetical protein